MPRSQTNPQTTQRSPIFFLHQHSTMSPSRSLFLAIALAGVHSFAFEAEPPQITQPPTPTVQPRGAVAGGSGTPILSTLSYAYTNLPYQVYPFPVLRGPQFGFNQCNSSTLGQNSNCQTLIFNGPVSWFIFVVSCKISSESVKF